MTESSGTILDGESRSDGRGAGTGPRDAPIPTIVLGGTGYVAGELLRLIAAHPRFELAAVMSDSQPGEPLAKAFPHLAAAYGDTRFQSQAQVQALVTGIPHCAVFGAAPHGVSAALIDSLLTAASRAAAINPRIRSSTGASPTTTRSTRTP